ncbi:MAG: efflux RND transporter permease subunit [Planctomycetota bacterium]|jgi:HAE1 family hydrophobic/amphiphilic exporter-1|nr:efflux RND transporter permease subunit [Planctomycetota bacterium]
MNLPRFAIQRPIFTVMVTLIVLIIGGISLTRLPLDLMPDISNPIVSIRTEYENAGPEVVEELVTRPIEEAVAAVPGAEEVTSNSSEGNSNVTVRFAWGTDLDAAVSDVRDRIDRIIDNLPDDCDRPVLFKFDFSSMPVVFVGISSEMDPVALRTLIDEQIKFRIESIGGVASMTLFGGREREILVDIDPYRLKAVGARLGRVMEVLKLANVNRPAGYVDSGNHEITIRAPGDFSSMEEIRETILFVRDGAPVRIGDVAEVSDGMNRVRRISRIDSLNGIRMAVMKQSGANTVAVAARVVEEIEAIRREYSNLNVKIIINTADYINNSINNVAVSAVAGGGLAIFLVLFFLRNILSTLVIAISIPISIVATFAVLFLSGLTLNLMTLGGLALGVGMLVDSSIVVLENIYRIRDEEGLKAAAAAEKGTNEVYAAIIASTLTTLVVFLPLVFIKGMAGLMFREFASVVAFSLACSLAAAVLLVPMLATRMIRLQAKKPLTGLTRRLFNLSESLFLRMEGEYRNAVAWCLDRRWSTLALVGLLLAGSLALLAKIDREQFPKTDEGSLIIDAEMETGIRLAMMDDRTKFLEEKIRELVPETRAMVSSVGGNSWRGVATHQASVNVRLGTREERRRTGGRTTEQIARELRQAFASLPGMTVRVREGRSFGRGGMGGGSEPVQVYVRGHDLDVSSELADQVLGIMKNIPGVVDARITREGRVREAQLRIDRRKAADLGLWVEDIAAFLEICMAGKTAAQYRSGGKEYNIVVRLRDSEKMTIDELLGLSLANSDGRQVSLRNVIEVEDDQGPTVIERKDQQRVSNIRGSLSGERALGSVMDDLRREVRTIPLPSGFSLQFGTDYQDQQEMLEDLVFGVILSLVLVYMVMACQFESLRDPFVVMFSVPLAAIGVLVMLFLTDTTINMQSMIGCILLGGVVVNNAIILVDYAGLLRRRDGLSVRSALEEAGRRRLRPILITSLSTMLGLIPLAIGWGDGGEAQAPMARAVIGGLLTSTFITLLVIPVVYSLVESGRELSGATSKRLQARPGDASAPSAR